MREMKKIKSKVEFSLDYRQIAIAFTGGLLVVVIVFALGVMVGKSLKAIPQDMTVDASAPTDEAAPENTGDAAVAAEEANAAQAVREQKSPYEAVNVPTGGEQSAPAAAQPAAPGTSGSYAFYEGVRADGSKSAPPPAAHTAEPTPAAAVVNAPRAAVQPAQPPVAAARAAASAAPVVTPAKAAAPSAAKQAAPQAPPVAAEKASSKAASKEPGKDFNGRYTVQVSSFQIQADADAMVRRLVQKGYPAYKISAEIPGKGRWHRVRIGTFASRDDATKFAKDFEEKENLETYITFKTR
jgi:DedD protein